MIQEDLGNDINFREVVSTSGTRVENVKEGVSMRERVSERERGETSLNEINVRRQRLYHFLTVCYHIFASVTSENAARGSDKLKLSDYRGVPSSRVLAFALDRCEERRNRNKN